MTVKEKVKKTKKVTKSEKPAAVPPVEVQEPKIEAPEPAAVKTYEWKRKEAVAPKTTVKRCIVIDKDDHWHTGTPVDLQGIDTTGFTFGYYGTRYPVLVENDAGELEPFYLPDAVGESSNRLFKGANPDGFRSTFKHRSSLLSKIAVGLMVALVLGLFFIMFILINF